MNLSKHLALLRLIHSREDKIGNLINLIFLAFSFLILLFTSHRDDFRSFGVILFLITFAAIPARWWVFYCIGIKSQYNLVDLSTVPKLYNTISELSIFLIFFISFTYSFISVTMLSEMLIFSENLTLIFFLIFLHSILFMVIFLASFSINVNEKIRSAILMLSLNSSQKLKLKDSNLLEVILFEFFNIVYYKFKSTKNQIYMKKIENFFDLKLLLSPIYHISVLIVNFLLIFFMFILNDPRSHFSFEFNFTILSLVSCLYSFYNFYDIKKTFIKRSQEKSIASLLPGFFSKENINILLGRFLVRYFFINLAFSILFNLIVSYIVIKVFHQNLFGTSWFILFTPLFFCFILRDYNQAFKNPINQVFLFSSILLAFIFTLLLNSPNLPYFLLMKVILLIFMAAVVIWAYFLWKKMFTSSELLAVLYPD